ncbi:MAG: GFA family protein [Polyangiaceae bacterium]
MKIEEGQIHKGRCLCGAVELEAVGVPVVVAHCHCKDCQRLTGAGHSTGAMFPVSRFRLTGAVSEYTLTSEAGNEVTRVFCPSCGSPILGRNTGMPGFVTVSLGVLEDSSAFEPGVVIFARNRKPWDAMGGAIPTFDAQPHWRPEGKG